ncbi:MAG: acetoacetate decarboxylase family protein [Actinobacteria bacterium]|nr:acetoacetate decarboxylase family protein [Actinomycetota bacterium]
MPFVTPKDRIDEIRGRLDPARFTLEGVAVEFETTESFVEAVLPPVFEPVDRPVGLVRVHQMRSGMCGDFSACTTVLRAKYGSVEGQYCLAMFISEDMPVSVGREFWGEPKKIGVGSFFRDGDQVVAVGSRYGCRLVEIEAELGEDVGPLTADDNALEIKAWMSPDGGLMAPPVVFVHHVNSRLDWVREGTAKVELRSGEGDPLGEIPIVATGTARHYAGEVTYEAGPTTPIEDGESVLPYIYGRAYDDLAAMPAPARFREQPARA